MYPQAANGPLAPATSSPTGQPGPTSRPSWTGSYGPPPGSDSPPGLAPTPAMPAGGGSGWGRPQEQQPTLGPDRYRLRVRAGVRATIVHRLVDMNIRHSMHAWNVRRDRPVAPWAVGFLYAYPTGTDIDGIERYGIGAATRLVDDDEELPGPAHLLYRLASVASDRYRNEQGWLDPAAMCTYRDPVPATATYVGVAVSCLGSTDQSWATLRRGDSDDIPGHAYTLLTDNTAMLLTRASRRDLGTVTVHVTGDLAYQHDQPGRSWVSHPDVSTMPGAVPTVWDQLNGLHHLAGQQTPLPTLEPDPSRGRSQ